MKIRKTSPLLIVIVLMFGGISPALADCCSSLFDCAAAAVTDGLSCELETIVSTIKSLVNIVNNTIQDVDGQTQAAERSARQLVSDTINSMQSTSQQSAADLVQAKTQSRFDLQRRDRSTRSRPRDGQPSRERQVSLAADALRATARIPDGDAGS